MARLRNCRHGSENGVDEVQCWRVLLFVVHPHTGNQLNTNIGRNKSTNVLFFHVKKYATGIGSSPLLSEIQTHLTTNWFLGSLTSGFIGAALSDWLVSLKLKGMVLMRTIILLSLVACGELV